MYVDIRPENDRSDSIPLRFDSYVDREEKNEICAMGICDRRRLRRVADRADVLCGGAGRARLPPPITHPEYFYGFVGVTLAWQLVFLLIAANPAGLRRVMLPSIAEKAAFGLAAVALFVEQRTSVLILGFGCVDLVLGVLFVAAYRLTRSRALAPSRRAGNAAGAPGNA
jgi:hypothetical protein